MKGRITITIIVISILIGVLAIIKINNIKVIVHNDGGVELKSNVTQEYIYNNELEHTIKFIDNNEELTYNYKDLGIDLEISNSAIDYISNNIIIKDNNFNTEYTYNKLKDNINKLNNARRKNEYASLEKIENNFIIKDEVIGNYIDTEKLFNYIVANLGKDIEIDLTQYYEEFDKTKLSKEHYEKELNKLENTYIAYTNGYKLTLKDLHTFVDVENNKLVIKDSSEDYFKTIDKLLETNLKEYDTVGNKKQFRTSSGEDIEVSGGTWGNYYSSDLETEYIIELFNKFNNENDRTPIYSIEYGDIIPNTYIEVSIDKQHLWVYQDGKLVLESDCVTGAKNKHDTPKGTYYISEKINGKYLTGEDYKTWVNKWMRLTNTGIGLHDASWRSNFGDNIYSYNGSHGCINLPKSLAYKLYDIIERKTAVVIY